MQGPIETGNIILIIIGTLLLLSGPFIIYRTVRGIIGGNRQYFSCLLNLIIATLFTVAGYLFIVNNLRGNPLAML